MTAAGIEQAVSYIRSKTKLVPEVCLVLGSGLGDFADGVDGEHIPYADIPGFPISTAPGHEGLLHIGTCLGRSVVVMQGRVHLYEGYQPAEVVFPMRVMAGLGATTAILTNAAGGLDDALCVGDVVAIEDHLSIPNLSGGDPMRGPHDPQMGERFVTMNKAYDAALIEAAEQVAARAGQTLKRGVYAFVVGPTFETPAEVRMLQSLGCQLVGMSTVPEVIAARQHGLSVLAISVVTNMSVSSTEDHRITTEQDVWDTMVAIKPRFQELISGILGTI
jgi:purine-nucleoside phosphorylase